MEIQLGPFYLIISSVVDALGLKKGYSLQKIATSEL
jgi:hypothetical protein